MYTLIYVYIYTYIIMLLLCVNVYTHLDICVRAKISDVFLQNFILILI